ncbi:restriction endonuclease [Treponema pedis str. T A4]|uniref:Restriction endonuclease n=2 Tax=Treponema pedis TaxID=409322 RepID=S5ZZ62_9SPIR|nr:restriction endonuclease [Treponema pedis str. T A4]
MLENGLLSIGFSDFCNTEFLNKVSENDWDFFEEEFQKRWEFLPKNRYNLWRFVAEMDKGNWVIVPSLKSFSVYEITDAYAFLASDKTLTLPATDWNGIPILRDKKTGLLKLKNKDDSIDLGFIRKVKPICKDIPRKEYADAGLTARMKIRSTNADICDLAESITHAIKNFKINKPINLKSEIFNKSIPVCKDVIKKYLNPDKFEQLIKKYFETLGASSVIIPAKNPSEKKGCEDVDIVAYFDKISTAVNIQAKFHDGETSDWAVQQISEFAKTQKYNNDEYSNQYWVISMADSFSEKCQKLAIENKVKLINADQFIEMLLNMGIQNLDVL